MMPELEAVILLVLATSFGALVTSHFALCVGLLLRRPRWRGLLALIVPVLAPYWGIEQRMRIRSGIWLLALVAFFGSRIAATY